MSFISHLAGESFYRGKFSPPFVIEIVLTKREWSVKKNQLSTEAGEQWEQYLLCFLQHVDYKKTT